MTTFYDFSGGMESAAPRPALVVHVALMLGALYQALRSANVDEAQAQKAAEEVAGYESRLATIENRLVILQTGAGIIIALLLLILGKVW